MWGVVIGVALGAVLAVIALVIWAAGSDLPSYADGYEAGEHAANEKNAVIIRGLIKKQQLHEAAFNARKDMIQAVIDAYKEAHQE